jgi:ABC-type dipeptide/oligopeptide/nickel transport system ATPase component
MNFSCIYVSHDLSILSNISERLMIMYLGRIMELGITKEVITEPYHPYAQALIAAVPIPDPIDPPPGCRFQTRCLQVMDICRGTEPPLKEVKPGHAVACHLY